MTQEKEENVKWIRFPISREAKNRLDLLAARKTLEKGERQNLERVAAEYFERCIMSEDMPEAG